jgi:hypothetical protein
MKKAKYLAGVAACAISAGLSWAAGLWQTLPIIGGGSYCASSVIVGPAQQTITGQSGTPAAAGATTGNVICGSTEPAGPPALVGTEVIPVDLNTPGTAQAAGGPSTAVLPVTLLGAGYGTIQLGSTTGTGQSITIGNGVSNFIYDGSNTATIAFTTPSAPFQNDRFCVNNAATNIVTMTMSANSGQSLFQGAAPTSLAVQVATAAGALNSVCYVFNVANTTWYRLN